MVVIKRISIIALIFYFPKSWTYENREWPLTEWPLI